MQTRVELNILLNSWESGVTHFRKLTKVEWEQWENQQNTGLAESEEAEDSDIIHAITFASTVTLARSANALEDSTQAMGATGECLQVPVRVIHILMPPIL